MIEITNHTRFAVDKQLFLGVAKNVLKGENKEIKSLSIVFVTPAEIKKINYTYRKKNKPTDVLSFGTLNDPLPEIVICPAVVREKTGMRGNKEIVNSLIHGILHILGYDHEISEREEERMLLKQNNYLKKIFT